MNENRRDFLKTAALAAGTAVAGALGGDLGLVLESSAEAKEVEPPLTAAMTADGKVVYLDSSGKAVPFRSHAPENSEARKGIPGRKWSMVIDLSKCDGCGGCTEACQKMHFIPPDREWIKVFKMQDAPDTAPYYFPKPCFQCDNPPCTKVCPVDATFKREDGIVLIDNERCIGCRFCMAACPYSTRFFNWDEPRDPPEADAQPYSPEWGFPRRMGTVEKCDFCPEMAAQGRLPACAEVCPMGAIYFGDQNEDAVTNSKKETERLSTLLTDRAGYRYLEELGTQPRVFYLPPKSRIYPPPAGEEGGDENA